MNQQKQNSAPVFDVVIVAGGSGTRLAASRPKAFVDIADKPLFMHSLEVFELHERTASIILVVPSEMVARAETILSSWRFEKNVRVTPGGGERWLSVQNGAALCSAEWIMVHDAARPFVTAAVIDAVLEKSSAYDAVITATPETDTVRAFDGDRCRETLDRTKLLRVGTPQLFRAKLLMQAFSQASAMASPPTDEVMLMEKMGIPAGFAWGDPLNFKITTPGDLRIAEALCREPSE
jgi:2-C-methyl-D-erythritol 4-phosphate cytidylyltransferase